MYDMLYFDGQRQQQADCREWVLASFEPTGLLSLDMAFCSGTECNA
jgi:hypothetical protein